MYGVLKNTLDRVGWQVRKRSQQLSVRDGRPAPPRKKASLAPPRENWQNLRGGAGQSLFESLEN